MNAPASALQSLATVSVGRPITRVGVSLIPVYVHGPSIAVRTGRGEGALITELPNAEVPTLLAQNPTADPFLLVSGDVVEGGRQTRVLDVSVLVPAHGSLPIPVSCVEQGRWGGGPEFRSSAAFAPRRVRRAKDMTVSRNLDGGRGKHADQGAVWATVADELSRLDAVNQSMRLSAAAERRVDAGHDHLGAAIDELRRRGPLPQQSGVVVAHGSRIVSAEVFAAPSLFAAHWEALVAGIMLDAPSHVSRSAPSLTRALRFVDRFATAAATVTEGVGLGCEHHVRSSRLVGQALVLDDVVVHASAFALAA